MRPHGNLYRCSPLLLAPLLVALASCADTSFVGTVGPGISSVASVSVVVDSATLATGHTAQASAQATDASGNVIDGQTVTWSSLSPTVASVSPTGVVTALAVGDAQIAAEVLGKSGSKGFKVIPPDTGSIVSGIAQGLLASANFDDGTLGPFFDPWATAMDFLDDPTASGKGKVLRIHYKKGSSDDSNHALAFMHGVKAGQSLFFKGEVYFPLTTFDDVNYPVRKLLYWQPHLAYAKYAGSGNRTFYSVLVMQGSDLFIESGFVAQDGTARGVNAKVATLRPQTWYTIEKQITAESSVGAGDGVIRIWVDGVQVFEKTNMSWSDVAWIGQPVPGGNSTPVSASDVYFENFLVGEQVNWSASYDEYRYWNNVSFSTTRPTY